MTDTPFATQIIRDDFDRLAQFDADAWNHNNHYHAYLLRFVPARCADSLDIGCGAGAFTRLLAQRSARVLGLDLSPEMISVARARSAGYANIRYEVADVLARPFPEAGYDCIASIATLHHLPLTQILAEIRDALRPGGVLLVLDLFRCQGWLDRALSFPGAPASLALRLLKRGNLRESEAARQAWAIHGQHDIYPTLTMVRQACQAVLPGAAIKRHLLWRYSIVWRKPALDGG